MDGSIKVEQTQATSGGTMPRRSLRNIGLLAACQALTQSSNTLMFASSALAVLTIVSPDMRMWANLPITVQHLGGEVRRYSLRVGTRLDDPPDHRSVFHGLRPGPWSDALG